MTEITSTIKTSKSLYYEIKNTYLEHVWSMALEDN